MRKNKNVSMLNSISYAFIRFCSFPHSFHKPTLYVCILFLVFFSCLFLSACQCWTCLVQFHTNKILTSCSLCTDFEKNRFFFYIVLYSIACIKLLFIYWSCMMMFSHQALYFYSVTLNSVWKQFVYRAFFLILS